MESGAYKAKAGRRSIRVPLDLSIRISEQTGISKAVTVTVNLHGALIRTVTPLQIGCEIQVTVYLTNKSSLARVVHVADDDPLTCGIELDNPQNIWGVPLTPDDWE